MLASFNCNSHGPSASPPPCGRACSREDHDLPSGDGTPLTELMTDAAKCCHNLDISSSTMKTLNFWTFFIHFSPPLDHHFGMFCLFPFGTPTWSCVILDAKIVLEVLPRRWHFGMVHRAFWRKYGRGTTGNVVVAVCNGRIASLHHPSSSPLAREQITRTDVDLRLPHVIRKCCQLTKR